MSLRQPDHWPEGEILRLRHRSRVLENNPWGDPCERELCVYLPHGYSETGGAPHVCLWDLAAFTNSGLGHLNWRHRGENLAQRLDRLIGSGAMPPVIVAMPDCFTSLGGNQYINSAGVGRYADYLLEELVPFLEKRVNIRRGCEGRGAFGKSSGGYGALVQAMLYPDAWGGVASHAGDMGFEWVYAPSFPVACRVLARYGGDTAKFLDAFWTKRKAGSDDYAALMAIAMAATYDPDPDDPSRVFLPVSVDKCEWLPDRWDRWLEWDPVRLLEGHADNLRRLRILYLDVGNSDEYHIQFATRRFTARLEERGIEHHFEEFEGSHRDLDWRLDISLPILARGLAGD